MGSGIPEKKIRAPLRYVALFFGSEAVRKQEETIREKRIFNHLLSGKGHVTAIRRGHLPKQLGKPPVLCKGEGPGEARGREQKNGSLRTSLCQKGHPRGSTKTALGVHVLSSYVRGQGRR